MAKEVATKTARIIAFVAETHRRGNVKVVDVVTATVSADKHQEKPHVQATAAAPAGEYPTYMVGATGGRSGLPVVFISGYTGPQ